VACLVGSMALLASAVSGCATSAPSARAEAPAVAPAPPPPPPPVLRGPKKRVGVVDFDDVAHGDRFFGGVRNALAEGTRDAVTEALVKSGAFVVIDREQIAHLLAEQGLAGQGIVSPESAAKLGKVLGLQAIITGKITLFDLQTRTFGFGGIGSVENIFHAKVSLRVIDATTGEIWLADSAEGRATAQGLEVGRYRQGNQDNTIPKKALDNAIENLLPKLVARATSRRWMSTVAKAGKDLKVYITGGSESGLPVGATLLVNHLGEAITDPTTGQEIGREVGQQVGTLRVSQHLNDRVTVCVQVNGKGLAPGDVVTLDQLPAAESQKPEVVVQ
jgi:curli biogenesis system outer membrane secretion channel CsgG